MAKTNADGEAFQDLHFPSSGIDVQAAFDRQPNRPAADGVYYRTTPLGVNVRAYEPLTDRKRGGQRPGFTKYVAGQVNGSAGIQCLNSIVVTQGIVPGSGSSAGPFIGLIGTFNLTGTPTAVRLGCYDPVGALRAAGFNLGGTATTVRYSYSVSARSFAAGGVNPSYADIGVPDGTGVTVSTAVWESRDEDLTASTGASLDQVANDKRITTTSVTLPFALAADTAACVPSTYHIITGLLRSTEGRMAVLAVDDEGSVVWSNANVVATSEAFTGTFDYAYTVGTRNGAKKFSASAISGTYILTTFPNTGLIRCDLTDGDNGSVITTLASLVTMAGSGYTMSQRSGTLAVAGGVAAVPMVGLSGTESAGGLAFVTVADGTSAFTALTGLQTSPIVQTDNINSRDSGTIVRVTTDDTHFYCVITTDLVLNRNAVVKKVNGGTGAVMWTTVLNYSGYGEHVRIIYAGGTVQVNAPNYSAALNATTGVVSGEGFVGGTHTLSGACNAGNVTLGATSIGSGTETGPYDALVAVAGGTVKVRADGAWQSVTNGTTALSTTAKVVRASPNGRYILFADGTNEKYYDSADNTIKPWLALAGNLPVDGGGGRPRLVTTWRGRTVLSGLARDPRNWFMSAVNNPFDYDYSPISVTPKQAIAGNNAPQGFVGDVITGFLPYTDDLLFIGGDHTVWMFQGDPMAGGQIDLVTNAIGVAWGNAFATDPNGAVYFFSNLGGVFRMVPGQKPVRISQSIERLMKRVNLGESLVLLQWNDRSQGLHVFVTPYVEGITQHFFWEARTNAWWVDEYANTAHSPLACYTYEDSAIPGQSVLFGGFDGYVRSFADSAGTDDGQAIESEVWIGPLLTQDLDELMLHNLQAVLGETSGDVSWSVHLGETAEQALSSTAADSGTWNAGRNTLDLVRQSGYAVYLRITSSNPWAMEAVRAKYALLGKVRRRGK